MKNILGSSWRPRLAGILTLVLPPLLWAGLVNGLKLSENTSTEVSAALLGILASYGLFNAKQSNVSNSPRPLATAQPIVINTPQTAPPAPVPLAQPVPTIPAKVSTP